MTIPSVGKQQRLKKQLYPRDLIVDKQQFVEISPGTLIHVGEALAGDGEKKRKRRRKPGVKKGQGKPRPATLEEMLALKAPDPDKRSSLIQPYNPAKRR